MSEPEVVPMTPDDLWLRSDVLPGLLRGWCGPVETVAPSGRWVPCCAVDGKVDGGHGALTRLDCRRPEVQARLADVLADLKGPDLSEVLTIRRASSTSLPLLLRNTQAAALCWLAVERYVAKLSVSCNVFRAPSELSGLRVNMLARGDILRVSADMLLLPLPDGRIGRLEGHSG